LKRTAVINVVGLSSSLIGKHTPRIREFVETGWSRAIRPAFPAVTCTAQSNYLTGLPPREHGIVGNGWYDREYSEVWFWRQSNRLVRGRKLWEELRETNPDFTCAKIFWWFNMYSTADWSITPRPMYPADGRKIFDIYTRPASVREEIKKDLGEFPFFNFWGPKAGIQSSKWIAASARWIEEKFAPTLSLVYLPHLDYNLQRLGPADPAIADDLRAIDEVAGDLIAYYSRRDVQVLLLSEYGISEVDRPIHLNRVFRAQGWIAIREELGLELLDCGASRAFAVADHQVAHIYVNDPSIKSEVRALIERQEGIAEVLDGAGKVARRIDHTRAGDLVVVAESGSWFTYYYWNDDRVAPDFARCVDIHRKPGYDPVELFIDPALRLPALKVAAFFSKKRLGIRALLDVIPLDASLVKGSHGRVPDDRTEWPVLIGRTARPPVTSELDSCDVYRTLIDAVS
jgi:predicted AlkP superfamily pyrophosphatase or phosphodiesterase